MEGEIKKNRNISLGKYIIKENNKERNNKRCKLGDVEN